MNPLLLLRIVSWSLFSLAGLFSIWSVANIFRGLNEIAVHPAITSKPKTAEFRMLAEQNIIKQMNDELQRFGRPHQYGSLEIAAAVIAGSNHLDSPTQQAMVQLLESELDKETQSKIVRILALGGPSTSNHLPEPCVWMLTKFATEADSGVLANRVPPPQRVNEWARMLQKVKTHPTFGAISRTSQTLRNGQFAAPGDLASALIEGGHTRCDGVKKALAFAKDIGLSETDLNALRKELGEDEASQIVLVESVRAVIRDRTIRVEIKIPETIAQSTKDEIVNLFTEYFSDLDPTRPPDPWISKLLSIAAQLDDATIASIVECKFTDSGRFFGEFLDAFLKHPSEITAQWLASSFDEVSRPTIATSFLDSQKDLVDKYLLKEKFGLSPSSVAPKFTDEELRVLLTKIQSNKLTKFELRQLIESDLSPHQQELVAKEAWKYIVLHTESPQSLRHPIRLFAKAASESDLRKLALLNSDSAFSSIVKTDVALAMLRLCDNQPVRFGEFASIKFLPIEVVRNHWTEVESVVCKHVVSSDESQWQPYFITSMGQGGPESIKALKIVYDRANLSEPYKRAISAALGNENITNE